MGMAKRISKSQREEVLDLLSQGHDRKTIAARVGVTPGSGVRDQRSRHNRYL